MSASIFASNTRHGATASPDGSYRLELPAGRHELRVRALGYRLRRDTVDVTANATISLDIALVRSVVDLQQIVVTGTRREDRTVVDAPVPVDVFTSRNITLSGRTETATILAMLAPSLNFPRTSVADGTDHIRSATLRGLGPDQVLILVNGRRRHTSSLVNVNNALGRGSSAVDLNAIPASAIECIEVLRDGAAAQYGSDAIAGVINVILKTDAPSELSSTFGRTAEGFWSCCSVWATSRSGWVSASKRRARSGPCTRRRSSQRRCLLRAR